MLDPVPFNFSDELDSRFYWMSQHADSCFNVDIFVS